MLMGLKFAVEAEYIYTVQVLVQKSLLIPAS